MERNKMSIKINNNFWRSIVVSAFLFGLFTVFNSPEAFAATRTWDGGGGDSNWNTAQNWDTDTAPVNGDSVIFSLSNNAYATTNNISNLSLSGITVQGTPNGMTSITSTTPLTLTGNVNNNETSGSNFTLFGSLVLGSNVIIKNTEISSRVGNEATDTLNLNGNTLTVTTATPYTGSTHGIDISIVGNGVFNIDVRNSVSLYIASSIYAPNGNTYTGTTNIMSGLVTSNGGNSNTMFGTSLINVYPTSTLSVETNNINPFTFNNQINIMQAVVIDNSYLEDQLYVWGDVPNQVINIPNITLNGNARFSANDTGAAGMTINLAGITANNYCVQYGNEDNWQASWFLNGPPACVITNTASVPIVPGVPSAGALKNNTLFVAIAGLASVLLIGLGIRKGMVLAKARK